MTHTVRQFRALTKKNFISWYRQPCCAIFQLLCPGALMFILVYVRTRISVVDEPQIDYELSKQPFFPVLEFQGATANPQWSTSDFQITSQRQQDFFIYDNYTNGTYSIASDPRSPLYFLPSNCLEKNSIMLPKVPSPIVAVIGPSNPIQDTVQSYLDELFAFQQLVQPGITPDYVFQNFATKADFDTYVSSTGYFNATMPGVCFGFSITQNSANDYGVDMYFNDQTLMGGTKSVGIPSQLVPSWSPSQTEPRITNYGQYTLNGYSMLQNLIANVVLKLSTGDNASTISIMAVPEPSAASTLDSFSQILSGILPLLLLFMYILPVFTIVSLIVKEKESKTKESMRMMGMTDTPYWLSWLAYYTVLNTILSLVAWLVLCINVIGASNPFYIFLMIWMYGQSIFGEIIFMQALFSKSKFSGLFSAVIYFTSVLANIPVQSATAAKSTKFILSLLPQVAVQQMAGVLAGFESANVGIHNATINEWYDNYTYLEGLVCLALAFFLFTFLGLYLDKVLPKEYGNSEPFYFLCSPRFWGCCRPQGVDQDEEDEQRKSTLKNVGRESTVDNFEAKNLKPQYYEPVAADVAKLELDDRVLKVDNLQKTYENGFVAVKGINVKMFQGQIFALLGQNGAGKTTTISMLTGLLPASAGKASVYNKDIFRDMQEVRQDMGVCPQHDVLLDLLTPEEHLDLFFELKGGDTNKKQKEIADMIRDVGLTTDKDKLSGSLSGGNKRKLSVTLALVGGSKLVLLDEPTSGMDLSARRGLWNMLRKYRRDRIIILTTHYMDEADVLGDRIGIMANGQLKCLGSSLFLKNNFGGGYKLIMVKKFKKANKVVEPFLKTYFGEELNKLSEISSEITFMIPKEKRNIFQEFFEDFDRKLDELEIKSYGISITTLEEVFLAINAEHRDENQFDHNAPPAIIGLGDENFDAVAMEKEFDKDVVDGKIVEDTRVSLNEGKKEDPLEGNLVLGSNCCNNTYALLIKRAQIYGRDICGLMCELIVPFLMVLMGCGFAQIKYLKNSPPRLLEPSQFPLPQRIAMNQFDVIPPTVVGQDPIAFYNNLPNVADSFTLTELTETEYYPFYDAIFNERTVGKPQPTRYGSYQIYQADGVAHNYQVNAQLNLTSQDVTALYPQFMYESILKTAMNDPDFQFQVTTVPFPVFYVFKQREEAGSSFDFAFMVGIGLSLIPTVIVSFILKEREENLKHMQLVSGMSKVGYWFSNMIADIFKAYLPIFCILLLTVIFNTNYTGVWVLYLLFPPAIVMFSYTFTFFFTSETSAQIIIFAINFLIGGIMSIFVLTLQIIPQTAHLGAQLRWWFTLCPAFCVTHGIIFSSSSALISTAQPDFNTDLWAFQNLLGDAIMLQVHFWFGLIFLVVVETEIFACLASLSVMSMPYPKEDLELDEDVIAEEIRVGNQVRNPKIQTNDDPEMALMNNSEQPFDVIRVSGFRKAYTTLLGKPFLAVERISFGLDYGECFALLGVNGAGKSTTFKSLTGDVRPTYGELSISGYNISREFAQARKLIGYCPQKDAIFPLLTVEEHLWFYCRLKGIPTDLHREMVEKTILEMNLKDHRTKPSGTLSGGNKRKLSVAIATMGNPPIILLDEPSAGMDPEARRFMWSVVEKISQRDKKSAVILTTHSMEEAEALSTKMGIMVRGGIFRCFGSSQHIKNKYGTGFEIQLKIRKANHEDTDEIIERCGFDKNQSLATNLQDAIQKCTNANINNIIIDEIKEGGLGSDLFTEAQANNGCILLENLVSYLFVQQNGIEIITILARIFENVEMLEQCADFYKLKVPRQDVTIGYLFGLIEDKKDINNISEYSVTQTSLEQIFQQFALLEFDDKASLTFVTVNDKLSLLNPDRRTTFVQKNRQSTYSNKMLLGPSKDSQTKKTPQVDDSKFDDSALVYGKPVASEDSQLLVNPNHATKGGEITEEIKPEDDGKVPTKDGDQGVQLTNNINQTDDTVAHSGVKNDGNQGNEP